MSRYRPGWGALPMRERCRLIVGLARELADDPPLCFLDWGVIGVAAGWREHEREGRVSRGRAPVLALMVRRKRPMASIAAARRIPPCWPVTLGQGRSRRRYQVPIDVCRLPRASAHGPRVALSNGSGREGAACVVLEDDVDWRWLLSCHHVIGDSSVDPGLVPRASLGITLRGRNGLHRLDPLRRFGLLRAGRRKCVDAALARIDPADPVGPADWSRYPHAVADTDAHWKDEARMLSPRGPIRLRFVRHHHDLTVHYLSGASAGIRELFEFHAVDAVPQGGDSGSAVLDGEGRWLGMHIAGDSRASFVLPAYVLLDPNALQARYYLSTS
ncbi:hypothetical protein [Arenimonas composti]|uniref:Peptidase S1 domain-containing protein n=1 Tax=Arenimonas composti TR7-09 = DSM 18010 TaxID=1121013 RepID=A0A091B9Q3_9GAMM|nr:hypothetical protein [Arenimonas composti]KFN48232.1 hypothetical protein P873_01360 [Arenimonas composti TR7-09 = DSM 18010]